MKRNLDHSALPSAEEIQLYQQGKLAPHRAHEIEMIAEENPMLSDALEGYNALPVFNAVPGITAAVSTQASGVAACSKSATVASYTGSAWWHLNGWILGLGIGVSAALAIVAVTSEDDTAGSKETTLVQPPIAEVQNEQQAVLDEHLIVSESPGSSKTTTAPTVKSAALAQQTAEVKSKSRTALYEELEGMPQASPAQAMVSKVVEPLLAPSLQIIEPSLQPLRVENTALVAVAMVTLQNHRVADYSQLRTRSFEPMKLEEIGLPASYADYEVKQQAQMSENKVVAVPYLNFVEQCILAFKNEEYKTAIKGFNRILSQYEDDINAQFYGAMSYYHNDQPVLALQLFEKAEKNTITSFREEIMFYKAKCLKMLNRTDESTVLFEKVISKNGFYKVQAQKELQD